MVWRLEYECCLGWKVLSPNQMGTRAFSTLQDSVKVSFVKRSWEVFFFIVVFFSFLVF